MSSLFKIVLDMAVAVAVVRLENSPVETDTPIKTFELERVPPIPPSVPPFPIVLTTPLADTMYGMPTPRMPLGVLFPKQTSS